MRQQVKCVSCGGTYVTTQPDGHVYYHACAPLPPDINGVQAEVATKRDENIVMDGLGKGTGIKAAGKGVTVVGSVA